MKGNFVTEKLNKRGLFISEIWQDKAFQGKTNPEGYFAMVIEPLQGNEKGIIYYQEWHGKFLVEGELYVLSGEKQSLEKQIISYSRKYKKRAFEYIKRDDIRLEDNCKYE